jgi:hypothetical protein
MESDPHQRARFLASEGRISAIVAKDEVWLRRHVAECAECAQYETQVEAVVRGLKSFLFDVDPGMTGRIQHAVAAHNRTPVLPPWRALVAAAVLVAGAVPLYLGARDARLQKADALLMEKVESRVAREVPIAMEPLTQSQSEEAK